MEYTVETRIIIDENGFKKEQMRILPVEDWEPDEGWRTIRILEATKS